MNRILLEGKAEVISDPRPDFAPRVSVIIPTYNTQDYICEAVDSVLNQTLKNIELIIIDDGSTDNTLSVLKPYFHTIRYIRQENSGPSVARNRAINEARGEFVAFLDSDDYYLLTTKLEEQLACFDADNYLDIVHAGLRVVYEGSSKYADRELWRNCPTLDLEGWLKWKPVFLGAMMIRRESLLQIGGFDTRFPPSEDAELTLRLGLMGCKATWLKKIVVGYRQRSTSISSNAVKQAKALKGVMNNFFSLPNVPPKLKKMEGEVRYDTLVWNAWCFYSNGNYFEMAEHLKESLNYTPYSLTKTIADWINFFTNVATDGYGYKLNPYDLNNLSEWKELMHYVINANLQKQKTLASVDYA